jgi:starch-binding outer membrane protein, SusD/RagB family
MRANVILEQLPRAQRFADERNKARYESEAKFMRAYFNFVLARNFGNPPVVPQLISAVADSRLPNSQPGEIWDLIESDLAFAAANLPESWDAANAGRATRYAALSLLAKARLYRAQWLDQPAKYQEAIQALEPVVTSGQFRLMDDYGDNFRESHQNNAESLFEIQMARGDFNPWMPVDYPGGVGAAGAAA